MSAQSKWLLILLLLVVTACTPLQRRPSSPSPYYSATEHQIMVMLSQTPTHFRPDASYASGYDAHFGREARQRTAAKIAAEHDLKLVAEWPMAALGVDCFVMEASAKTATTSLADLLSKDPRVESAQAVNLFHTLGHNDPLFALQPDACCRPLYR